jgi:xylulokinase
MESVISNDKTALLGLDVGTSSTKVVAFTPFGVELARAVSEPIRYNTPQPGWIEQDPEVLWRSILGVLQNVIQQLGGDFDKIVLSIAAQSGSLVPADKAGNPVCPIITWMDGRTEQLVARWRDAGLQAKVRSISGWSLYSGLCLPTIAWLREYDPETFARAEHYFTVNDFIVYRLTGARVNNPSNASGMQLLELQRAEWSETLCMLGGINPAQLSLIQPTGSIIGEIKTDICQEIGLPAGSILVNGGHDQVCTALGLGLHEPGKYMLACGTAWVVTGIVDSPDMVCVPEKMDLNFHALPGRWTISQSLGGLGAALDWWLGQAWLEHYNDRFASLFKELEQSQSNGQLYFIPLTGGFDDPSTTRSGGFIGLQLSHTRIDMARAILESAAYELNWALDVLRQAGKPMDCLWMVGGGARSIYWSELLSNITGIPLYVPDYDHWPALGAALIAGMGAGFFKDIHSALAQFRRTFRKVEPNLQHMTYYRENFEKYRSYRHVFRDLV